MMTAMQIRMFIQNKHHIDGRILLDTRGLPAVASFLGFLSRGKTRTSHRVRNNITGIGVRKNETAMVPHTMPDATQLLMPRTHSPIARHNTY